MSSEDQKPVDRQEAASRESLPATDSGDGAVAAWEEIETGRYMPRRIRGSCVGRALG